MSHEHDHDHDHHAAPKQSSRPGPARGRAGTGQPALSPQEEQFEQALFAHQARHLLREAHQRAAARAGASTDAADTAHAAHATHVGPARGRADTGQPALSAPPRPQAILLHQAHHLLREAHQRAAAKAGAPTDAAHDGHTAAAVHAALTGDQDRDYFSQVQGDLAAGKFADALSLLDSHWPASAHDRTEARAYVGGVIIARLHATLAPLTMDRMLHALEQVRPRLDEVIMGGHHLRDLLLASAGGLDHDRLAYALALLTKGGVDLVNTGDQPHYIVDHYEDFEGAVAYLKLKGAITLEPIQQDYSGYETFLTEQNDHYATTVSAAIDDAVKSVGYDPVVYGAWWGAIFDTLLAGAGCLLPELAPIAVYGPVVAGAAVGAATSWPGTQQTFQDSVKLNVGGPTETENKTNWRVVANHIAKTVSDCHREGTAKGTARWTDHRARLEMLRRLFKPEFITVYGGGLPMLDTDAITQKTTRDLLLRAVNKTGAGGHLVYEYTATNVFRTESVDREDGVYYHPATWRYTPGRVVLAVAPQLVDVLNKQEAAQPIVSSDVDAPATIIVTTPSFDGTPFRIFLHLDHTDNITGLAPPPSYWWDGQRVELLSQKDEWAQSLRTFAWLASGGRGTRPQARVSAVAQESGSL